jgi:sulfofructosephosphate aldolase
VTLQAIARPTGTFLMIAMDQRESLRTMLAEHHAAVGAEQLRRFKLAVARELAPLASGLLLDAGPALEHVVADEPLPETCGLIVAADSLVQERGGLVEDTAIDERLDLADLQAAGAAALKLLVIWRPDGDDRRRAMARRFVELAGEHGLPSILEGVVRAVPGREGQFDREAAIVAAASELAAAEPSLYKVEVPLRGRAEPAELERRCAEIDRAVGRPWVVLSSGVEPDDFPAAVEAACRAGASGMLAGRAIWRAALPAAEPTALLRERAAPRLRELAAIVDQHGRPWRDKIRA